MLAVRRIDERVFRRKVHVTVDSKGKGFGVVREPDEDNVNLDKTQPDLSYELIMTPFYVFSFDKNEQCLLRQCSVKII